MSSMYGVRRIYFWGHWLDEKHIVDQTRTLTLTYRWWHTCELSIGSWLSTDLGLRTVKYSEIEKNTCAAKECLKIAWTDQIWSRFARLTCLEFGTGKKENGCFTNPKKRRSFICTPPRPGHHPPLSLPPPGPADWRCCILASGGEFTMNDALNARRCIYPANSVNLLILGMPSPSRYPSPPRYQYLAWG